MCHRGQQEWLRSAPIRRLRHPLEESPVWGVLGSVLAGLVSLLVGLPMLVVACVLVPCCLVARHLLLLLFWSRHSDDDAAGGPESVRGNDSQWLGSAWRRSVIHAVLVFEAGSGLDVARLRQLLLTRVVPLYPRLTRRPVPLPLSAGAGHCWLPDCAFDIQRHVFPGPSLLVTEKDLQEYVARLLSEGLPADKPPWEVHVVQGYGRHADTVAVLRVHQSVADGMALVRVLCHSLADCHILHVPQRPHFGAVAFALNVVRACLVGPLTLLLWLVLRAGDRNLLTQRAGSAWTGRATVTWSAAITLPKVTRIKQVTRCSVNCVLLSALAGAARRLLQGCGIKQPRDMKVVLPVDMRADTSPAGRPSPRLGSKVAPVVLGLPVSVEGAVPRLWATRRHLDALRASADHAVVYVATAALMCVAPGRLARELLAALAGKASLQFSSLPGPTSALMVGGHLLKGVYPLLPAQGAVGMAVSVFTYADQVYVAVIADSALGPAANTLLDNLHAQIELLWKLLLHRRVPGESRPHLAGLRPDVTGSPVRELRFRLSMVQKEVQKLSQSSKLEIEAARLQHLKTEFSQLLTELQRRHSHIGNSSAYFEDDEVDGELRPRRRAMSCTTSRCSSLSLTGLLGPGRPASYVEPSREGPEALAAEDTKPYSGTPTKPSRHHHGQPPPAGGRRSSGASRAGSRQTLNVDPPLPEELVDEGTSEDCHGVSKVHYVNECPDRTGTPRTRSGTAASGKSAPGPDATVTASETSKLVTKVECYVRDGSGTDDDAPGKRGSRARRSPRGSPARQHPECLPLLPKDHGARSTTPHHSVKHLRRYVCPPCMDTSHSSCGDGCHGATGDPPQPRGRTDGNSHQREPAANSVPYACECSALGPGDSNAHNTNSVPHKVFEFVKPDDAKCHNSQKT